MKKFCFILCFMLIIPAMFLFAGCSSKDNIDIRISDGYVQWSYEGEDNWVNIISVDDIKETLGESYKGETGTNGREIELRKQGGYLQWRYVGDTTWKSLAGDMYTISFDSQGGTSVDTITDIPENTKVKCPAEPTRDGYLFDGWYYQSEKWSFIGYTVSENMTLTAHWNPIFNLENNKILSLTPYASTLKTLNIPSKIDGVEITEINENAFENNLMLEKVVISDSIKKIGYGAFSGCSNITTFEGANNVEECADVYVLDSTKWYQTQKQGDKLITLGSICLGLGENYASNEVIINEGIKLILSYAFRDIGLTSITIPNSVTYIGDYAFSGCSNLTSINIPNSVTTLGRDVFLGCDKLKNTVDNLVYIKTITNDYYYLIDTINTTLTNAKIDEKCEIIGSSAFLHCRSLTSIIIPDSVTSIGDNAFCYCENLTSITISDNVTSIKENAFQYCRNLTSIIIPNSVTNIDSGAFSDCSNLTIYCEATSQPTNWGSYWNYSNCPVYWYSETEPTTSGNYWHYVDGVVKKWGVS